MAKPKADNGMEISLFPFLSILACVIGVLVLLIALLAVMQTQQIKGRTNKEIARAEEFVRLEKKFAQDNATLKELQSKIDEAAAAKQEFEDISQLNILLRKKLNLDGDGADPAETSAALQKEVENLEIALDEMRKQKPELDARIAELKAEMAARQKDPEDAAPAVVVQPGGAVKAEGRNVYFVEARGDGIVLYDYARKNGKNLRVGNNEIGADADYDVFLQQLADDPKHQLVFLVRSNGWTAYTRGAGWASDQFGIRFGKLPMPTAGKIDLSQFSEFLGELDPPLAPGEAAAKATEMEEDS